MSVSRSNRLSGVVALSRSSIADDQAADLRLGLLARHLREPLEVEPVQQLLVDAPLSSW